MPRYTKKGTDKRLLKEWSEKVKEKAGNRCEVCGRWDTLNSHHIVGKRNKRLRYCTRNGVCLCSEHHTLGTVSAHRDPLWFEGWLEKHRAEDFKYIKSVRNEMARYSIKDLRQMVNNIT